MKTMRIKFSLLVLLLMPLIMIAYPNKTGAHTETKDTQERSFQVEDWEKGLNKRQPPIKIMDAIGLNSGMIIGEIGAGTGRMTMWMAERVGDSGKVYANDIDRSALEHLKRRCKKDGFKNVEIVVGKMEDPGFQENSLDIAFMINVYHHLADPVPILRNLTPSLKADGTLAIVECDPDKVEWGDEHGCSGKEKMIRDLKMAGFEVVRIETFLDEDNIYIAKPVISY
jgi:ubiquinone/menaquinone biosynthesis C-methylase UbiE